ncbi:Imm49 family immunity protein [Pyxidicoccus xibeiensis]|uniref:Imm49 family immunity protein n=1 Tax=Pyxidicoccus xibeiensis TaxID=2906759 RepID=UPI0020A745CB|nr:Imm49 family immunity protein [Pyxidicoccus xibeiensis]MCP3143115.1 immunity 49 family protein [Pyxidicoccus xibeiensis]
MPNLMSLRSDAAAELGALLRSFQPDADRDVLLSDGEAIVLDLHLVATATLLVDGNAQGFFLGLCRMAENWRRLIVLLRSRNLPPPSVRRLTPLHAALAAGHFRLAEALAAVSATQRQSDDYEDEYLWGCILQGLARQESPTTLAPLLNRLEVVAENTHGPHVALTRALLARDAEGFAKAFETLHHAHGSDIEARAKAFDTPVTAFAPHRFIWLEGLALLRLAARAGVAPETTEYRYCPPLARLPMTAVYRGDWTIPGADLDSA